MLHDAIAQGDLSGGAGEREGPGVPVHRLEVDTARACGLDGNPHLGDDLARRETMLDTVVRRGRGEQLRDWQSMCAALALDDDLGIQRDERRGEVGRMDSDAGTLVEDGGILVLTVVGIAFRATFEPAI